MLLSLPDLDPKLFVQIRMWIRIWTLPSTSKQSKKNLDIFLLLFDFLSSQTDINVPLKINMQKNLFFVGFLTATDEKSTIWIQIFGSGSILKCHGSTTLHAGYKLTMYKVLGGYKGAASLGR